MSTTERSRSDEVGELFDEMADMIEVMGGNIHVGYWYDDDDTTPLLEAINRCTDIVGDKLGLGAGQRLLDIGCGAGVPATRIGQRTDAVITGVTNSRWQVQEATKRVKAAGLEGQVVIEHGDAAALPFADHSFDAVLAFESIPHAQDRGRWLREMARVARPGGRIVLTDFTCEVPITADEAAILRASGLEPPLPAAEAIEVVRANGVLVDGVEECGDNIRRSYPAYFERLARRRGDLVDAFGEDRVSDQEQEMEPLLAIYRQKIGYLILTGHTPT
jgi:N-methyltransferase StaMA